MESTSKRRGPRPPRAPGTFRERLHAFLNDPLSYVDRLAATGEPVLRMGVLNVELCIVNEPALIDEVLVKQHQRFTKDTYTRRLSEFLGNGLLTSEGSFWKRQRRLIQPAFHRKRIASYTAEMSRLAEAMVAGWVDGDVRDVHSDLMALTLEIVGRTLFGADVTDRAAVVGEAIELVMARYGGDVIEMWTPLWVPLPKNRRIRAAVSRVDDVLHEIIGARRRSGADTGDLLSLLLHVQDEDGARMSDRQLRDECITLFLAGHETTALNLSYALFLLAQRPEIQDALAAEVAEVVGERSAGFDDLADLRRCEQVIKEAMRLYPPAWSIGREALEPVELGGYRLKKGTQVAFFMWSLHRNPRYFPEPEAFRPERWTPEFERALPRHAYMPFGGGPRICIGNAFALAEAVLVLAAIVRRFRVEIAQAPTLTLRPSITLRPTGGVRVRLSARGA
ncbi:MAG: cytochrome P450 [Nannocystaceae bacterium]